jgi:hypothetical protein
MTFIFAGKESEVARACGMCLGEQRYLQGGKESEVARACGMCWGEQRYLQGFGKGA